RGGAPQRPAAAGQLDLQATVGGPAQQLRVDLLDSADARHHQPVHPEGAGVGRGREQAQPVAGGNGGLGADRDGPDGERAGVDLEWGGDLLPLGAGTAGTTTMRGSGAKAAATSYHAQSAR